MIAMGKTPVARPPPRWTRWVMALGLVAVWSCADARALDIQPLLPPTIPDTDSTPLPDAPPPPITPSENPDEVVVERLRRIKFDYFTPLPPVFPAAYALTPVEVPLGHIIPPVDNRIIALSQALDTPDSPLAQAVAAALRGPVTWKDLETLVAKTTETARAYGWSISRAYAPEQELTEGDLLIILIPVWLESVQVEGAKWSKPGRVRRPYAKSIGNVVTLKRLMAAHTASSQHPFRRIVPALAPGETSGTTQLKLTVEEKRRWRAFGGYETTHSRSSGSGRYFGGLIMAAPWRTDDILTLQYATDDQMDFLDSFSFSYQAALPWSHFLTFTGLYAKADTVTDRVVEQQTTDYLARLVYMAPLREWKGWNHELEAGLEWRRSEADNLFGGISYFYNMYDSAPLSLGWRGRRGDKWGVISLSGDMLLGLGDWIGDHMDDYAYGRHRQGVEPKWTAFRGEARREWFLPADLQMTNQVWGQWTPDRLTDATRFYLGGNRSIRGYRESEVVGDGGVGISNEVRSPSLAKAFNRWLAKRRPETEEAKAVNPNPLDLRLAAFFDWGMVYQNTPLSLGETTTTTLSGAGLGFRIGFTDRLNGRLDYAWRLHDTGTSTDDIKNGYLHGSINFMF